MSLFCFFLCWEYMFNLLWSISSDDCLHDVIIDHLLIWYAYLFWRFLLMCPWCLIFSDLPFLNFIQLSIFFLCHHWLIIGICSTLSYKLLLLEVIKYWNIERLRPTFCSVSKIKTNNASLFSTSIYNRTFPLLGALRINNLNKI